VSAVRTFGTRSWTRALLTAAMVGALLVLIVAVAVTL
jgi:hypothetical protein